MRWATVGSTACACPTTPSSARRTAAARLGDLLRWGAVGAGGDARGRSPMPRDVGRVKVREQFGQPIGSFRVSGTGAPRCCFRGGECPLGDLLRAAFARRAHQRQRESRIKSLRDQRRLSVTGNAFNADCFRIHGGIGFTWEYDLHLYFKRAKTLEASWGDSDYHRELIVRQLAG